MVAVILTTLIELKILRSPKDEVAVKTEPPSLMVSLMAQIEKNLYFRPRQGAKQQKQAKNVLDQVQIPERNAAKKDCKVCKIMM